MSRELIALVIRTAKHHVEYSADPEFHRSDDHVNAVVKPHLLRIHQLLESEHSSMFLEEITILNAEHPLAAQSLLLCIDLVRNHTLDECLAICMNKR